MTEKRLKAAASQAVSYRNYRRARDRALVRLANAYPDDYKELLEQEKAIDETQGRKWLDIDGNTNSLDTKSANQSAPTSKAGNPGENQSNNGRKA
jgi:hypothetical protein